MVQKDQTLLNIHAPPSCAFVNNEIVLLPWEIKNSYVLGIVFSIDRFKQALTTLKKIISIVINFGENLPYHHLFYSTIYKLISQ